MDVEDLVAVLEAEQPLPLALVQEKPTQIACAVVGIETRRDDETKTTGRPQQRVRLLEEQLVQIQVCRPLMPKWVRVVHEPTACRPRVAPAPMEVGARPAATDRQKCRRHRQRQGRQRRLRRRRRNSIAPGSRHSSRAIASRRPGRRSSRPAAGLPPVCHRTCIGDRCSKRTPSSWAWQCPTVGCRGLHQIRNARR